MNDEHENECDKGLDENALSCWQWRGDARYAQVANVIRRRSGLQKYEINLTIKVMQISVICASILGGKSESSAADRCKKLPR